MIPALLLAFLFAAQPDTPPGPASYFRYQRDVEVDRAGQACAVIDAPIYPHAAASLKDLRLFPASRGAAGHEIPYVLTLSEAQGTENEPARILNLGTSAGRIVFDLAMPQRAYTDVTLDLDGTDFLATATVTGSSKPNSPGGTRLGEFTLFDLSSQHLSRSTVLHLQESSFPYLHVVLAVSPIGSHPRSAKPEMVQGANVPPSREAQTIFTLAAETRSLTERGRETVASFHLPERVPVERISFVLAPGFHGNFSRDVRISARTLGEAASPAEVATGTIQRVELTQAGRDVRDLQLSVPATLGANLQKPADVEIAVQNGDDPPIGIAAVRLEMRERRVCFEAPDDRGAILLYGDPDLPAPQYDYARLFTPSATAGTARLGPERINPEWKERPDDRPFTERHPHLLWIGLLVVVCVLAMVAFRSSRVSLAKH